MYVFDNVVDMDFSSMYPHIIITFNVAPNTMIGKLIIGGDIQEAYKNASEDGKVEDAGKDFFNHVNTSFLYLSYHLPQPSVYILKMFL